MEFSELDCHSETFRTKRDSAVATLEFKNALLGLRKLFNSKSTHNKPASAVDAPAPARAQIPGLVQQALLSLGPKRTENMQRELLVMHACLATVLNEHPLALEETLTTGKISLAVLEQLFSHPEFGFEQHEFLRVFRLSQHFRLVSGNHPADNLPTYELAQHWLSHQAPWAVQKLLNSLPEKGDDTAAEHAYMRALIACSPLPANFQVPLKLSIEIALLASETDNQGQPLHDLENLLRARLYGVTPVKTPRDPASLMLTEYRNRRLALLNHGLVSHQGALEVFQQIQAGEIDPLLGCNVLSSFIRMGLSYCDDLLYQMAEQLNHHRRQLHPNRVRKTANLPTH